MHSSERQHNFCLAMQQHNAILLRHWHEANISACLPATVQASSLGSVAASPQHEGTQLFQQQESSPSSHNSTPGGEQGQLTAAQQLNTSAGTPAVRPLKIQVVRQKTSSLSKQEEQTWEAALSVATQVLSSLVQVCTWQMQMANTESIQQCAAHCTLLGSSRRTKVVDSWSG